MVSLEQAAEIMGENFISIDEVKNIFCCSKLSFLGKSYKDGSQEAVLRKGVNFSEETLKNGWVLVPGIGISMYTISRMFHYSFCRPDSWITEEFGHEKVENRWYLFNAFDQNSECRTMVQLEKEVKPNEEIPRGCEMAYLRFVLYAMNRHLFDVRPWFQARSFLTRNLWTSNIQTGRHDCRGNRLWICDRRPYIMSAGAAKTTNIGVTLLPSVKSE